MNLIERWFREALKPDPVMTVSQWADSHRVLSKKSSAESGKWRTERTPYLREIMDCLSVIHPAKKIVFKKASQVGGTEAGNNWLGYIIDYAPGPVMFVLPRIDDAKRNSKLRIDPLIEENPKLKAKMGVAKSRDSNNTILQKGFEGGELVLTGANSAAGLRSMPARFLFLDEIDAYPTDVEEEGDPVSLAMARSRTFSRRKAFLCSTPTIEGESKISEEFEQSDKRFYNVPCPHCEGFQVFKFENLKWPEGKPEKASYYCEHCGEEIQERYKTKMLALGKWVPTAESSTVGFALNSLYSPIGWFSWAEVASDYLEAKRQMEQEKKTTLMKTFVNTVLGETFKETGEAPDWKLLYMRRENYEIGTIPAGGLFLTCGVDVQKDRFEAEVVAWGINKESWSVDYHVIPGDTSLEETWAKLGAYIERSFIHANGHELPIRLTAIDSGYNTQMVYNFCRKYSITRVIPVKGMDELSMAVSQPRAVDVKIQGKTIRRGVKVWPVGSSLIKSELYGWVRIDPPIAGEKPFTGFCHWPEYAEEYFKQLCAERVVTKKNRKGFSAYEWVKDRERNEALDVRVYNRAAAAIIGIDRFKQKDWDNLVIKTTLVKKLEVVDNVKKSSKSQDGKMSVKKKNNSSFW